MGSGKREEVKDMVSHLVKAARGSRRVTVAVLVILTSFIALGTRPAEAQMGGPVFSPRNPTVLESDGEVVLTLSINWARPARVMYQTVDREAKAPGDYTAVSGEAVFTGGESRQIKISIVDDDFAEGDEAFTVRAWEDVEDSSPSYEGPPGTAATVTITDNDGVTVTGPPAGANSDDNPPASAAGSSTITPADGQLSASAVPAPVDPAATSTMTAAPPAEVALPSSELRPGPGFELMSEGAPEPAAEPTSGAGGSASGLAIGSGTAALGVGALAVLRRRRRWSPTQA